MFYTYNVSYNERAVVLHDGVPVSAVGPGRYRYFSKRQLRYFKTDEALFVASPEIRAMLPKGWYEEFKIGEDERAVLFQNGAPSVFLKPGIYWRWAFDETLKVQRFDARLPLAKPTQGLMSVVPKSAIAFQVVAEYERGLLYVAGKMEQVLKPGLYAFWTRADAPIAITKIDQRLQQLTITGQDLMTRDKVTLRLTLSAEYRVADPALMAQMTESPRDAIYLKAQLAARDYVASVKLDELLEGRSVMTEFMEEALRPSAAAMGLELGRVGVKDVILPGDMKLLLNRVIEAEKEAAAQVILRREEVAATRSLANSAKLMAEFPGVMRLKELDALREMAASVGELRLVMVPGKMGLEGLTHLLSEKSK